MADLLEIKAGQLCDEKRQGRCLVLDCLFECLHVCRPLRRDNTMLGK